MNQVYKNLALWMVIGLIVILLFTVFQGAQQSGQEQPNFSEFLRAVEQNRVESVVIRGNHVTYSLKDSPQTQRTYIVDYPDLIKMLRDRGVRIAVKPPDSNPWYAIFLQWVPMQEDRVPRVGVRWLHGDAHTPVAEHLDEVGVIDDVGPLRLRAVLQAVRDVIAADDDGFDAILLHRAEEFGEVRLLLPALLGPLEHGEEEDDDQADDHPEGEVFVNLVNVNEIIAPAEL